MLSLGYSSIPTQRSAGTAANKYFVQLPKGLSFNIFKPPMLPSFQYGNFGTTYNPPPLPAYQQNTQNLRSNPAPPGSNNVYSQTYRANISGAYDRVAGDEQRGISRHYNIRANNTDDVLIYQTSVSSNVNSDFTARSMGSSSSGSDIFSVIGSPAMSEDDVSSTMASSSTETLQSTLLPPTNPRTVQPSNTIYSSSLRVPDERTLAHDRAFPSVTQIQRSNSSKLSAQLDITNLVPSGQMVTRNSPPNTDSMRRPPSRMDRGDTIVRPDTSRRATVHDCPSSSSSSSSSASEISTTPELPTLETVAPRPLPSIPKDSQDRYSRADLRRFPADSSTSRITFADREYPASSEEAVYRESSREVIGFVSRPSEQRQRTRAISTGSVPLALKVDIPRRSVRWKEELVCPSPLPRPKGWFNRRGDQLWTNDGLYKPAEAGTEFPEDLTDYPDPNSGWMNELGVRIDMQHRLIPRLPRPALKQSVIRPESSRRATV